VAVPGSPGVSRQPGPFPVKEVKRMKRYTKATTTKVDERDMFAVLA
jgi:hypothetical protein